MLTLLYPQHDVVAAWRDDGHSRGGWYGRVSASSGGHV